MIPLDLVQGHCVRGKQTPHKHRHSSRLPRSQHQVQISIHQCKGMYFYWNFLNKTVHETPEHVPRGLIWKALAQPGGMSGDMQGEVRIQGTNGVTHGNSNWEATQCSSRP